MSTRLKGWIAAGLKEADYVEQAMWEIREGLWLKNAIGANLDLLGRVYNVTRQGRDDATYRTAIQLKAATSVNGTPDEIVRFLALIYDIADVEYTPEYPARYWISGALLPTVAQLSQISPAGVGGFPGEGISTIEGEYVTTIEGEKMLVVASSTSSGWIEDTINPAADAIEDRGNTSDTVLADTVEF